MTTPQNQLFETTMIVELPNGEKIAWRLTKEQTHRVEELQTQGIKLFTAIYQARQEIPGAELIAEPEQIVPIEQPSGLRELWSLTESQSNRAVELKKSGVLWRDAVIQALREIPSRMVTQQEYSELEKSDFNNI
ncbi:MAG: hypothetical protein RSC12_00835 [Alistipes sp.]